MSKNDQAKEVADIAGLIEEKNKQAFTEIYEAIKEISDKTPDSGYGKDGMDLWSTINGREFFITVKISNSQKLKESH